MTSEPNPDALSVTKVLQYGTCILEVNTAAAEIRKYDCWIQEYLCAKALLEAIDSFPKDPIKEEWISLDKLVGKYNGLVDKISLPTGVRSHFFLHRLFYEQLVA